MPRAAPEKKKAPPDQPGISEKLPVFAYQRDQVVLQPKGEWRRYNNLRADQINCLNTEFGPLKVKFLAVHANDVAYYAGSGFGIEITNPAGRQVPAKNGDPSGSKWQSRAQTGGLYSSLIAVRTKMEITPRCLLLH
jgi:hypothetical protein